MGADTDKKCLILTNTLYIILYMACVVDDQTLHEGRISYNLTANFTGNVININYHMFLQNGLGTHLGA